MKILQEMECGGFMQAVKLRGAKYDGRRGGEAGCLSHACVDEDDERRDASIIIIPVRFLGRDPAGSLKGKVLIASCLRLVWECR